MSERCPSCQSQTHVVTAVTVPALGREPCHVLVTLQCTSEPCQLKFPVFKTERDLELEERAHWRRR